MPFPFVAQTRHTVVFKDCMRAGQRHKFTTIVMRFSNLTKHARVVILLRLRSRRTSYLDLLCVKGVLCVVGRLRHRSAVGAHRREYFDRGSVGSIGVYRSNPDQQLRRLCCQAVVRRGRVSG